MFNNSFDNFEGLNYLTRSFWSTRAFLTAIELDIFTAIGNKASLNTIAKRIKADKRATEMLLNSIVALGFIKKEKSIYSLKSFAKKFLSKKSPHSIRTALMHSVYLWESWNFLTQSVKSGKRAPIHKKRDKNWREAFIAAMNYYATMGIDKLTKVINIKKASSMLDLGGGPGSHSILFGKSNPKLDLTILDLPEIIPLTKKYVSKSKIKNKVTYIKGDMLKASYGKGYDLIWISGICHMFTPEDNIKIYKKSKKALSSTGKFIIRDFLLNKDKCSPTQGALFALNMLVNTPAGNSYSIMEYKDWLKKAGFKKIRIENSFKGSGLIIAS